MRLLFSDRVSCVSVAMAAGVSNRKRALISEDSKLEKKLKQETLLLEDIYKPLYVGQHLLFCANVVELIRKIFLSDVSMRYRVQHFWKPDMSWVLATDEATAGNVLATCQQQKVTFLYGAILDGQQFSEPAWVTLAAVPRWMRDACGWAAIFAAIVACIRGQHLEAGFLLGGSLYRLHLKGLLGDYEGLSESFAGRGAAALKPCLRCGNVLMKASSAAGRGSFVSIEETAVEKFIPIQDGELFELYDKFLANPCPTQAAQTERERCFGFSVKADTLLAQRLDRVWLAPCMAIFDVCHCYFANGICSSEMILFKNAMETKNQFTLAEMRHIVDAEDWQRVLHAHRSGQNKYWRNKLLWDVFFKGKDYKGSASCVMALFPLFFLIVMRQLSGRAALALELASLCALARCLEALRCVRRSSGGPAWEGTLLMLHRSQCEHQKAFAIAYPGHSREKKCV